MMYSDTDRQARIERDKNLIVVYALDGYARNHGISTHEAVKIFKENDMFSLLRSQYEVLHTLALDESIQFTEDVLARRSGLQ